MSRASDDSLLTTSADGRTVLWRWIDGTLERTAEIDSLGQVDMGGEKFDADAWATVLYPDGSKFIAAGANGRVGVFSADPTSFGAGIQRFDISAKGAASAFFLSVALVRCC